MHEIVVQWFSFLVDIDKNPFHIIHPKLFLQETNL